MVRRQSSLAWSVKNDPFRIATTAANIPFILMSEDEIDFCEFCD